MRLDEFLRHLRVEDGPDGNGNYRCKCPAHDDKKGSLSVTAGPLERGQSAGKMCIKIKCFAGCTSEEILRSMGLKKSDLYTEPMNQSEPRITPGVKVPDEDNPNLRHPEPSRAPAKKEKKNRKLETVYHYTDEEGKILFDVLRYRNEDGSKDFLQGVPEPNRFGGYRWKTGDVRHPLYRLPEILDAKKKSKTIYVVEGEKDADTLAGLGYAATTNPGGAGKTIKWLPEHTKTLAGADIVILPDIDEVGLSDRRQVAGLLIDAGCRVKFIDLRKSGVQLPPKGDITDLIDAVGREEGDRILRRMVEAAAYVDKEDIMESGDWRERCIAEIANVPGYTVQENSICKYGKNGTIQPLSTFLALPRAEIFRDDGVEQQRFYQIDGWDRTGKPLNRLTVPDESFRNMSWVSRGWGFSANIMPGSAVADQLRYLIAEVGNKTARTFTQYAHTGWRKIGGQWVYLYQGGSLGGENLDVDLGNGLTQYTLDNISPAARAIPENTAALISYCMGMEVMSDRLRYPLLAEIYLAPLREPMEKAGCAPAFILYLNGKSGTGKSTVATLALAHFGNYHDGQFPATFADTGNAITKKAFLVKDALFAVDDYHPTKSLIERRKMETTMQGLCRAFGNHAARNRMNADSSLRESAPPRCVSLVTGEYVPDVGDSGVARCYVVNLKEGKDVKLNGDMTRLQDYARDGYYRRAMRGYIEWLRGQMDDMPDRINQIFRENRDRAIREGAKGQHARVPAMVAWLMAGYTMMLEYLKSLDIMDEDGAATEREKAFRILMTEADDQTAEQNEDRPCQEFCSMINELIANKSAAVIGLNEMARIPDKGMIGWMDGTSYYLLPETSYQMCVENYRRRGQEFPLTLRGLYKQLVDEGIARPDEKSGKSTRVRRFGQKAYRILEIPRIFIDGLENAEQLGFLRAENEEDPF